MGPADVMAEKVPQASKSSMKSDGSGDVTIEGFSDSKKVTRTFLLGSDSAFSPSAGNAQEPSRTGLASGSSCRGLSYISVSTMEPLELPKETLFRDACLVPFTSNFGFGLSVGVIVVLLATSLLLILLTLLSDDSVDVFTPPADVLMITFRVSESGWTVGNGEDAGPTWL